MSNMEGQSGENVETEVQKYMEALKDYIGKKVKIEYVSNGIPRKEEGTLKNVEEYRNIQIEGTGIPFIGHGSAIREIRGENGEVLYKNPRIPRDYDLRRDEDIAQLRALSFGQEIENKLEEEEIKATIEWIAEEAYLDIKAQQKAVDFIEEGRNLVKKELLEEWKEYVRKNTQNFYSAGVVEASVRVMKALSEGKTPEEAEGEIDKRITGFMAGCVAQTVAYFHPRGEEFRQYWNRKYLPEEEAEKSEGVVTPAILKIKM